jgi:hypothetical protein
VSSKSTAGAHPAIAPGAVGASAAKEDATMLTADGRCTWKTCTEKGVYRMVGSCWNCMAGPILLLFSGGHDAHALACPVCGVQQVRASRPAADDEIPAAESAEAVAPGE